MTTGTRPPRPRQSDDDPGDGDPIPRDELAERVVIGSALLSPASVDACAAAGLRAGHFWKPAHETLWNVILDLAADGKLEPGILAAELIQRGEILRVGGAPYLHTCIADVPTTANAPWYAQRIRALSRQRDLIRVGRRLVQIGSSAATDDEDVTVAHEAALKEIVAGIDDPLPGSRRRTRTVDEFLTTQDAEYDWLIPGTIERQDRLMLTGPEGGGKSTFFRQIAIQAAAGLHPFTGETFTPIRVLLVDLENSERQVRRKLRPLRHQAGSLLDPANLYVECRPRGLDLLQKADQAWLRELVADVKPDLLMTGPIYRMASGDPTEEKTAKPVSQTLDEIRDHGCALAIEAHVAKASNGSKRRPREPYGASLWLRWPEFGVFLDRDGTVEDWRGQRDERDWPAMLIRGGAWPWTPSNDPSALLWARIKQARHEFGEPMTFRDLEIAVGHSKSGIGRCLKAHDVEWQTINGGGYE